MLLFVAEVVGPSKSEKNEGVGAEEILEGMLFSLEDMVGQRASGSVTSSSMIESRLCWAIVVIVVTFNQSDRMYFSRCRQIWNNWDVV